MNFLRVFVLRVSVVRGSASDHLLMAFNSLGHLLRLQMHIRLRWTYSSIPKRMGVLLALDVRLGVSSWRSGDVTLVINQ